MHAITIKHRYTGAVLFEFQATDEQQASGLALRHAVEAAVSSSADLSGADLFCADLICADLRGADLRGADLSGADLRSADLRGADLSGADLIGAYLSGANLSGANLIGADLRDAYLRDAYLRGAKLIDGIVIQRAPLQISGLRWKVTIFDAHMQIGCKFHALAEWNAFDDETIAEMDGRDALRFWRAHKDALLSIARSDGRSFEPVAKHAEVA